jgi:hypothetical protein
VPAGGGQQGHGGGGQGAGGLGSLVGSLGSSIFGFGPLGTALHFGRGLIGGSEVDLPPWPLRTPLMILLILLALILGALLGAYFASRRRRPALE